MSKRGRTDAVGAIAIPVFPVVGLMAWPASGKAGEAAPSPGQRVVLVARSTGGLGRETALALSADRDHVIVHGRNGERGNAPVGGIMAAGKGGARV